MQIVYAPLVFLFVVLGICDLGRGNAATTWFKLDIKLKNDYESGNMDRFAFMDKCISKPCVRLRHAYAKSTGANWCMIQKAAFRYTTKRCRWASLFNEVL
ncbi:hypothetical protein LSAT2_015725 [Lamellibrachia satsuma]|nr:hypothetical protein LSAT2_015725 [Lamellibrachia satsuma]